MYHINPIENYKMHIKVWRVLAIWPEGNYKSFYKFYMRAFMFIFVLVYIFLFTLDFFFLPKKLDIYVENMIFYFTLIASYSKALTFYFKHDEMAEILKILQAGVFELKSKEELATIQKAMTFNKKYYYITLAVSLISHVTHFISPVIVHIFSSTPLILIVCRFSFLPEKIIQTFMYPLYLYQVIGLDCFMWYNVTIDTFFWGILALIIAHLEILDQRLQRVTDEGVTNNMKEYSENIVQEKIIILQLKDAFKQFNEISKFCCLVQRVLSVTLFIQFSMASAIICICVFRFILPTPVQYLIFLTTYMFIMTIQIFVPCVYGTRIIDKSTLLSRALYKCNWTVRSRNFKINMRMFMERTKRPLSMAGWKMFPLSLSTFTSIINTAYSFFTLLRHMNNK